MKKLCLAILGLSPFAVFSQMSVTPNSTATALAQTITGSGVTVSSATLNCGANAAGTFTYTGTNLGMTGGIILTTGAATDAANSGTYFASVQNGNTFNDPELVNIDPNATNDVCLLEFDFVPICSNINITFVFGSEEYPTFVNQFNDGFGIFLTGPNPGGGNYTSQNIGVLPNNTPVSINNVNAGTNSMYFVDNYSNPNNDVAYDGYTVPVTSTTPVYPCSTYHMKIGIADALDESYDSGVFIGNNAVSCTNAPTVTASSNPATCGGSNGNATATVTNYTGAVTYQWLPGNQTTATINGIPAGTYTCIVSYAAGCSSTTSQTVTTTVSNTGSSMSLSATSQSVTCSNGNNGSATVNISGGTSPFTTVWNTNPPQNGTTATGLTPGIWQATVTDNSGCVNTVTVNVGVSNPTTLQLSSTQVCGSVGTLTSPAGTNYQWYDPSNVIIAGANSQSYNASGITGGQYYTVTYTNNSTGCKDSVRINITQFNISFNPIVSSPCNGGNNGSLTFNPASGNTFTSFDWVLSGTSSDGGVAVSPPILMDSLAGGTYNVVISVNGNPGCAFTYSATLVPGQIPPAVIDTIRACNGDTVNLNPNVAGSTYNWYTGTTFLGSSTSGVPLTLYPLPYTGLNVNTNGAEYYDTIQSAAGCKSVYKAVIKTMSFNANISVIANLKCHDDSTGKLKVTVVRENDGPINQQYQFNWVYPLPYPSPAVAVANPPVPVSNIQSNLHPGYYYVIVSAGNCVDTLSYTLQNPAALPFDTMNAYFCPKDSLALIVAQPGHSTYFWVYNNAVVNGFTNDSIYVLTPNLSDYLVYYMTAGCRDTAKTRLDHPVYSAFRPDVAVNIFTPNGDKKNDFFYPFYDPSYTQYQVGKQMEDYEIAIFNRWGKKVFESTSYVSPWNGEFEGTPQQDGTYYWICRYKSNCSTKADIIEKHGFVQLLR